jgi:hypothetical protein
MPPKEDNRKVKLALVIQKVDSIAGIVDDIRTNCMRHHNDYHKQNERLALLEDNKLTVGRQIDTLFKNTREKRIPETKLQRIKQYAPVASAGGGGAAFIYLLIELVKGLVG